MFNNLNDFSEHLWFDTLRKISNEQKISFDDLLLLRNISVLLKDREKLEKLFTLIKMIPESSENEEYICRGDEKIEKIFKLVDNDINSETWGETLFGRRD